MIQIEKFPYGNQQTEKNPMHGKLLLLKLHTNINDKFAIGYYDAISDVFRICYSPFINTIKYEWERKRVNDGLYCSHYCVMPDSYTHVKGPRKFTHYLPLDHALTFIDRNHMQELDVADVLAEAKYSAPYLVCTKDLTICATETRSTLKGSTELGLCEPVDVNGQRMYMHGIMPRNAILYVVDLARFYKVTQYQESAGTDSAI